MYFQGESSQYQTASSVKIANGEFLVRSQFWTMMEGAGTTMLPNQADLTRDGLALSQTHCSALHWAADDSMHLAFQSTMQCTVHRAMHCNKVTYVALKKTVSATVQSVDQGWIGCWQRLYCLSSPFVIPFHSAATMAFSTIFQKPNIHVLRLFIQLLIAWLSEVGAWMNEFFLEKIIKIKSGEFVQRTIPSQTVSS